MLSPLLARLSAAVLVGVAFAACAPLYVSSYTERSADLGRYRSFAWAPAEGLYTGDPRLDNNDLFDTWVRAEVERGLTARGFEPATGAPDVLVHYHASVSQEIDWRQFDRAHGLCDDETCPPQVYEEGTLMVDLVDPRTTRVVWRGWAEGVLDGVIGNQARLEQTVTDAVERILARLPGRL